MIEQTVKSLWIHVEGFQYCQHWSIYTNPEAAKWNSHEIPSKVQQFYPSEVFQSLQQVDRFQTIRLWWSQDRRDCSASCSEGSFHLLSCEAHQSKSIQIQAICLVQFSLVKNSWKDDPFHRHSIFPPQPSKLGRADQCRCARPKPPVPSVASQASQTMPWNKLWLRDATPVATVPVLMD